MDLAGQGAVVTGAGQGIGRATALLLAQRGANVCVVDLNAGTAEETAAQIRDLGRQAVVCQTDVTDSAQVRAMVQRAIEALGQVHIFVNNVGWTRYTKFLEEDEAYWDRVLAINLKSQILCCHAILPHMIERQYGRIVNVSSDAGRLGVVNETVYSAAKAGVIGLTKALAREFARYNVLVNCIAPGSADTPLLHEMFTPEQIAERTKVVPLRRPAQPEEVAEGIVFMASPAARYITGQVLSVSGGVSMIG
jgi:2-hydroxycyclohexanecarboxyl-CoA dehydrogenase